MSNFPQDSAIKVQPGSSLEKEISEASSVSAIQEILHRAAVSQHLIAPDPLDRDGHDYFSYRPVEPGTAPHGFAKTLVVDGQKIILESATEEGLVQEELKVMRSLFDKPAATTQAEIEAEAARVANLERPRNAQGQFITHDPSAVALAPTVAAALEAQGISVDDLREFSASKQGEAFQQSWAEATETFRANHPDWMGGIDNMNLFARLLGENPELMNSEDKSAALEAVYNYAVENKMLVANPELTTRDAINKAQTYDELKAAVGHHDASSSGLWGR